MKLALGFKNIVYFLVATLIGAMATNGCTNANPAIGLFGSTANYSEFGTGIDGPGAFTTNITTASFVNGLNKKFSAAARVTGLSSDGTTLTVAPTTNMVKNPVFNSTYDDLDVGDEVTWVVVGANSNSLGPDNACGGNLYRGSFHGNFAYVKAISTTAGMVSSVTLDRAIATSSQVTDIINKGNLPNPLSSTSFCLLELVRVPNFTSLSISTLTSFTNFAAAPLDIAGLGLTASQGVYAMVQDQQGRLVIGGNFSGYNGSSTSGLMRLNTDGTQDFTFNPLGTGVGAGQVSALAVDTVGRILVAGNFTTYNYAGTNFSAASTGFIRLNSDGSPDSSFSVAANIGSYVNTLAVDSTNRIVVGGAFTGTYNYVERFNADGTVDTTFMNSAAGPNSLVLASYIDSSGKILISGQFTTVNGSAAPHLTRLNTDGTLDATLSLGTGFNSQVYSVTEDGSGNIYAGGTFTTFNGTASAGLVKLSTNGTFDTTFTANLGTGVSASGGIYQILILPSTSQILIGGSFTSFNGVSLANIARLSSSGVPDTTFNSGGAGPDSVVNVLMNYTGAVVGGQTLIGGQFLHYNGAPSVTFQRLSTNGTADPNFNFVGTGTGGILTFKVQNTMTLSATSSNILQINANAAGFQGGSGFSVPAAFGFGTTGPFVNDSGGASAGTGSAGGSGGANQGGGGTGGGGAGAAGSALSFCFGPCAADSKAFMGGGGGGGSSYTSSGGVGGGILAIYAHNVIATGTGTISLLASGGMGTGNSGGGAGGALLLEAKDISGTNVFTMAALGAPGGSGTFGGGGGGGGSVKIKTCTDEAALGGISAGGGVGGSSASPGSTGFTTTVINDPNICLNP